MQQPAHAEVTLEWYRGSGGVTAFGVRARSHADISALRRTLEGGGLEGSGLEGSGLEGSGLEGSGLEGRGLKSSGLETMMCFREDHCPHVVDEDRRWQRKGYAYWELSARPR
jgi:hypothetical protein